MNEGRVSGSSFGPSNDRYVGGKGHLREVMHRGSSRPAFAVPLQCRKCPLLPSPTVMRSENWQSGPSKCPLWFQQIRGALSSSTHSCCYDDPIFNFQIHREG